MARVRIGRIEGGPLPPAIAIVPPVKEGDRSASEKALEDLRPYMTRLSAVAPVWFRQKADGSVDPQPEEQGDLARMLAGYYRLRLLPVVDLPFRSEVPTEQIIACARSNNLAGVLVRCRMMPGQEWFDRMQQMLETNPVNVIVMRWPANPWDHVPIRKDMDASNIKVVPKDNTLIPDLLPGSTNSMDCIFREMMVGNPLLAPRRIEWPSRVNASEKDIRDARWSPLTPRVILLDAKNTNAISRIGKP